MASAGLNEESVEKKLMSVTNTQDSIQSLSLWIIHHKTHYAYIVELWFKVMKKSVKPSHRLTLFYLCNDVVQTCKRKKAQVFVSAFKPLLKEATALVRDATIRPKVERIFSIWEERQVFDKNFVTELRAILDGKQADGAVFKKPFSPTPKAKLKEKARQKGKQKKMETAPTSLDTDVGEDADVILASDKEETEKDDDVPSEDTLAAFKPSELIDKMRSYKKQASEVESSVQKLSHLKLDASSIEAIKHLKDRAHGNEFSNDFEESCLRLEETAEGLEKLHQEQKELLAQLHVSEHFYDQQHGEARIVANAYKSYGARINTVKKKLDDMLKMLPSPTASPAPQDLSPENSPPGLPSEATLMDCEPADNEDIHMANHNGDGTMSPVSLSEDDTSQVSGFDQLESRLTSFLPSLQSETSSSLTEKERPIPVYIPQPILTNDNSSVLRPSANKTLTESDELFHDEEGGSTPLTDEPPTTPVMDEEPENSPSPPPPPPPPLEKRKENPIDFLSRLISQSQKNSSQSNVGMNSSFLASFTRLTNQMKENAAQINSPVGKEEVEEENSTAGGSPRPKSWAEWKAEKAVEMASRVEQPNMSLPPPLIPGFAATPSSSLPSLGIPPAPPLPVPSISSLSSPSLAPLGIPPTPPMPVPSVPSLSSPSLAPLGIPPTPPMPVPSVPPPVTPSSLPPGMLSATSMPVVSVPPPGPPSALPPQVLPPESPVPVPSVPSLSSPSAPLGMPPVPPMPVPPASPLPSPPSLPPQHVSPVKHIALPSVPPPVSPSPISPLAGPLCTPLPVPSPGLTNPSSPFYEHTSPGQKENWPEVGEGMEAGEDIMHSPSMDYPAVQADMSFPPISMRPRTNNSVLRELTPSTEELPVSEFQSGSPPPPPPVSDSKQAQPGEEEGRAIATLASGPGRGGQGFMDKLMHKMSRGYVSSTYTPNPNLMTLTPGGDGDMEEEDEEEEEEEEEDRATRIPVLSSVVRRVDPREQRQNREKDRHSLRDRDFIKYPHSSGKHQQHIQTLQYHTSASSHRSENIRRERRYSRENSHDGYSASSSYSYRDRRSYGYDSVHPSTDYLPYCEHPYEDGGYNSYSTYGQPPASRPFQKYGVSQGSSQRSYRY